MNSTIKLPTIFKNIDVLEYLEKYSDNIGESFDTEYFIHLHDISYRVTFTPVFMISLMSQFDSPFNISNETADSLIIPNYVTYSTDFNMLYYILNKHYTDVTKPVLDKLDSLLNKVLKLDFSKTTLSVSSIKCYVKLIYDTDSNEYSLIRISDPTELFPSTELSVITKDLKLIKRNLLSDNNYAIINDNKG